ncbi:MAG: CoA transferase [Hydrogenophaga sp.]|uniref:CaiB/BaiF CoA transferase family protein n=1 Tax=Hydrogenophaga sp. TaxID=1904254 RepID=UPI0016B5280B|nr:CaiB/BaiF CoA-transferase family protein [Hydrogenophaga sp.]NIM42697.1 CoA transferase [Hydrogenophaga sp.]NIN25740.1 CoA transferase [Hydrogenophaga sp.]NIN30402.1 CoA transferase [Hydrogenophaga sp.]NIN56742.1 CoA transferase [Hydrogenophaga sp.]NIO53317.1 CoA transferase [Hydrogenophaga sp.]
MTPDTKRTGPLAGLRVAEFAGIGPGPFACMLLSDMGADVVTIDRPTRKPADRGNVTGRGRTVVTADLKDPSARETVFALLEKADVLVEGFRPGVMERLGLGPDAVLTRNPRLIYGRMTGWGQHGPLAQAAGHDLNYIAITGAAHAIGPANGAPVPPLNLVGDYGGGGMYLLVGILAALHEAGRSGRGQVVDAAITDGTISLMANFVGHAARGNFREARGSNTLDGGAPFYGAYETADGRHVSIGPLEPQFFAELCERVGVPEGLRDAQNDRARWPELRATFERIFRGETQAEWTRRLEGTDVCFAPILPLSEAARHPHNVARQAFVDIDGVDHPAPAPRFSRTPGRIQGPAPREVTDIAAVLGRWR